MPQVYPDSGVAAMLKNSWKDVDYGISSLTDRRPVQDEDDLVVLAAPDPQGTQKRFTSFWASLALQGDCNWSEGLARKGDLSASRIN